MSEKTKEIDPKGKGVSEASFRNKALEHIQSVMIELGIGKYEAPQVPHWFTHWYGRRLDNLVLAEKHLRRRGSIGCLR